MAFYRNRRTLITGYLMTAVFCIAIAGLTWYLMGETFLDNAILSLCIGMSITSMFAFVEPILGRRLPAIPSAVVLTAIGLLVGLFFAGLFLIGNPWFFLIEQQTSLFIGVFFGAVGFAIFGTHTRLQQIQLELAQAQASKAAQAQLITETELRLLQAQIEPHFLFNTISNVTSMIHSNPAGAEQMLTNLSTLLRRTLSRTRAPTTTLGDELDILKAYLDIQSMRMNPRLQYHIESDPDLRQRTLPPMLIQPLVENAIQHGIEPCETGGEIWITICASGGELLCTVTDSGQGMNTMSAGNGLGLQNINQRLQALYQGAASLTLSDFEPRGVKAQLRLPANADAAIGQ